jgi:hypothetical protein
MNTERDFARKFGVVSEKLRRAYDMGESISLAAKTGTTDSVFRQTLDELSVTTQRSVLLEDATDEFSGNPQFLNRVDF